MLFYFLDISVLCDRSLLQPLLDVGKVLGSLHKVGKLRSGLEDLEMFIYFYSLGNYSSPSAPLFLSDRSDRRSEGQPK